MMRNLLLIFSVKRKSLSFPEADLTGKVLTTSVLFIFHSFQFLKSLWRDSRIFFLITDSKPYKINIKIKIVTHSDTAHNTINCCCNISEKAYIPNSVLLWHHAAVQTFSYTSKKSPAYCSTQ